MAIFDTDPQRSACAWAAARDNDPPVVPVDSGQLAAALAAAAEDGYDLVLIDTPPHNTAATAAVVRASDLCLLPLRPSPFDLAALPATVQIVQATARPGLIVLNAVPATGSEGAEAREAAAEMGLPVWEGQLGERRAFRKNVARGRTVIDPADPADRRGAKQAAEEIRALWCYLASQIAH